jgi:hypothetical protein
VRDLETENGLPALFELDAHHVTPRACADDAERLQRPSHHSDNGVPLLLTDGLSPPCIDVMRRAVFMVVRKPEGSTDREMAPKTVRGEGADA